jgi:hypothetical protein
MYKKFRNISICLFGVFLMFSCIKKHGRKETEENLKTAMELSLNQKPGADTSQIKFRVLEVSFFEGPKVYTCEFKVNLKQKMQDRLVDTTGFMKAEITKDFNTVSRIY